MNSLKMAKTTSFVLSPIFLLSVIFILALSEIGAAAAPKLPKLCERTSKTFSGKCAAKACDTKCIKWEKAAHGTCHKREGKDTCFCYFDCTKAPKPGKGDAPPGKDAPAKDAPPPAAGGSPPPPAGGDSPPPPAGGDSPPPADGGGSPPPADGGSPPPSSH